MWPVLILLTVAVAPAGCAGPIGEPLPHAASEAVKPVYVVDHGWHTGIALRRADVPDGVWPELHELAVSEFVEVGWGDRDFYMAPEGTLWLGLKAVFWPTPGVLRVVAFDGSPGRFFSGQEIVELAVPASRFRRLAIFIQDAYARDARGRTVVAGPSPYANSAFYTARETYVLWRTCNTWTARALREAGLPMTPLAALTATGVIDQARKVGAEVRPGRGGQPTGH